MHMCRGQLRIVPEHLGAFEVQLHHIPRTVDALDTEHGRGARRSGHGARRDRAVDQREGGQDRDLVRLEQHGRDGVAATA